MPSPIRTRSAPALPASSSCFLADSVITRPVPRALPCPAKFRREKPLFRSLKRRL
jgi:hypothetical protein